jgi:hypothetical protein
MIPINHAKLREVLEDEYDEYIKVKEKVKSEQLASEKITIYYPGAGRDFATILLMIDALAPKAKNIKIILLDTREFFDGFLHEVETYLVKSKIKQTSELSAVAEVDTVAFEFKYYIADFETTLPKELDEYDIYYERAFEMFRSHATMGIYRSMKSLRSGGLAITDHSFDFGSLSSRFEKLKYIPSGFGLYHQFQIWKKK